MRELAIGMQKLRICALLTMSLIVAGCNTGFGRSGNADLSRLVITPDAGTVTLDPSFRSSETEYEARVTTLTTEVSFNATTDSELATMTLNGAAFANDTESQEFTLTQGRNEFRIEVTAENERTKTYEIVITQAASTSDDDDLTGLDVAFTDIDKSFSAGDTSYSAGLSYWVNSTTVIYEKSHADASVVLDVQTAAFGEGVPSNPIDIPVHSGSDSTALTLTVTSGNGDETQDYSAELTRSAKSDLSPQYFKASNPDNDDRFGSAVAMDGNYLVVGAFQEDSNDDESLDNNAISGAGAVYVYEDQGSSWSSTVAYVKRSGEGITISVDDNFGRSVAIQNETLVVGVPGANEVQVFLKGVGNTWNHSQTLAPNSPGSAAQFGRSVSIEDDYLIVGAPGDNEVYIYAHDGSIWAEDSDSPVSESSVVTFGHSVELNRYSEAPEFIVGAPGTNSEAGSVHVYTFDEDDGWEGENVDLTDLNLQAGDRFGEAVSISRNRLIVGAPGEASNTTGILSDDVSDNTDLEDAGAAYIFARSNQGVEWEFETYLKSPRSRAVKFGSSVSLNADMVAVGAPEENSDWQGLGDEEDGDNDSVDNSGAVYIYSQASSDDWSLDTFAKIPATNSGDASERVDDNFGEALFFHGNNLVIGVPGEDGDNVWPAGFDTGGSSTGAVIIYR